MTHTVLHGVLAHTVLQGVPPSDPHGATQRLTTLGVAPSDMQCHLTDSRGNIVGKESHPMHAVFERARSTVATNGVRQGDDVLARRGLTTCDVGQAQP